MLGVHEEYWTLDEVAERLKISRRSVGRLITSGALPAIRITAERGSVRIAESDLKAFLEARRTAPRPSEAEEED